MARQIKKLSPRGVETMKTPGRHSDGGGLYLVIDKSGAKRWAFIYRWREPGTKGAGKLREMGLGSFTAVGLARAREKAAEVRESLDKKIDPIAAARVDREILTFGAKIMEPILQRQIYAAERLGWELADSDDQRECDAYEIEVPEDSIRLDYALRCHSER